MKPRLSLNLLTVMDFTGSYMLSVETWIRNLREREY
jgi:hypothetical protein